MSIGAKEVEKLALKLPVVEKARLVDKLLASLDRPDSRTDALWKKEVEDRIEAYRAGKMKAVHIKDVLAKYGKKR
jgi:putative addiction module component (TIGR02574 family)